MNPPPLPLTVAMAAGSLLPAIVTWKLSVPEKPGLGS